MTYNIGDLVKFAECMADENPNQVYAIREVKGDRVDIVALGTGLTFPPITTCLLADLIPAINIGIGDIITVRLGNEVLTGSVTSTGTHKGQTVIDFMPENSNQERFCYLNQVIAVS